MNKLGTIFVVLTLLISGIISPPVKAEGAAWEVGMATGNTLLFITDEALEARLADMEKLGITWLRVDFNWSLVQFKGYHSFDFSYHDRVVAAAARHGMKVLGMLAYTPGWARNTKCTALISGEEAQQKCTPRDSNEFARFAKATAEYFAPKGVKAWEVWNEPNLKGYWKWVGAGGQFEVNPEAYGRMVNAAGQAIHAADPTATVITGGLAPVYDPNDPRGMRQGDYIRRLGATLQAGSVNAVGMHPYTWPALPREHFDWNAFYTVDNGSDPYNLRRILEAAGKPELTVWGTEFGASTVGIRDIINDPDDRKDSNKVFDHVTESMQSTIMQQAIEDWNKKQKVGPLFIHADSDQWLQTRTNEGGYGLRRSDGSEKPSYQAVKTSLEALKATAVTE